MCGTSQILIKTKFGKVVILSSKDLSEYFPLPPVGLMKSEN
jgi:hypothetical protein